MNENFILVILLIISATTLVITGHSDVAVIPFIIAVLVYLGV